ncbi:uncharacterized protein MONOS_8547 [Monocercomonoides exilis]|uniref:uncharacterized protein n=1 Tax=Monocercomonoides exilis TaxID=2049356 RepID=UPI003559DE8C|nr:hypothetical protein MONOS_8547 [Monocercomonoides exilis]|eukprot:MONOS_8547.1-p1 / transcript=MONOS_8547.1 / gene=MONOS_8547 / organism=Monocercomonoides_exilis_PA203 / gene_product=unspecified product / transcript_product=unspecified product / location=Mono_scaffold00325:13452-14044(+) / protein_length=153 / sequence_SO=supercontig / SO=protein_coding / is_pseudo=false
MTPPPHLNEEILSALTYQADEVAAGGEGKYTNGKDIAGVLEAVGGDEMLNKVADVISEQEQRLGSTEGGEVGVGGEEGGSVESMMSRAGEGGGNGQICWRGEGCLGKNKDGWSKGGRAGQPRKRGRRTQPVVRRGGRRGKSGLIQRYFSIER